MSSQEGSEATSQDSEEYGRVARAGFSRMYVLLRSAQSPLDVSMDYRSDCGDKRTDVDGDTTDTQRGRSGRYDDLEGRFDEDDELEKLQLLYVNGRHYFHGVIPLPDAIADVDEGEGQRDDEEDVERSQPQRRTRGGERVERIGVDDLPLLLPHFHKHQDGLTCIDSVTDFRQELRDVVYQMEEVGEFMVEELSKGKVIARIEEGSREFHWMVSPQNPTFFELQTYRRTNESMQDAGVVIIVLKIVVRGVLLDVIYHKDSYFITLRENEDELALEDTFIPNLSCIGPCYIVRRYSDADLKQLLLWCSFPPDSAFVVRGENAQRIFDQPMKTLHLPVQSMSTVLKVATVRTPSLSSILEANDTQLYCLLPSESTKHHRQKNSRRDRDAKDDDDDDAVQDADVVFQFSQFVYSGSTRVRPSSLDDLGKLSSTVLPSLKSQALKSLAFFGSMGDCADPTELPVSIQWTIHVKKRFEDIATTLVHLMTESQVWVETFLSEVDAAARDSAKTKTNADWLGSHLRAWLDNPDGTEYFYELELSVSSQFLWGKCDGLELSDVGLLIWKGVVNAAVVVIVYRRASFFIVLREVEDITRMPQDGLEFFGLLPELDGKGRGYLVRKFPSHIQRRSQQWLSGAKFLLWQTIASVAREDLAAEDAQSKWQQSQTKRDEDKETSAWFEEKADDKVEGSDQAVRRAERVGDKDNKPVSNGLSSPQGCQAHGPRDKSGKRHHLAPLGGAQSRVVAIPAPWDIRTGRPI